MKKEPRGLLLANHSDVTSALAHIALRAGVTLDPKSYDRSIYENEDSLTSLVLWLRQHDLNAFGMNVSQDILGEILIGPKYGHLVIITRTGEVIYNKDPDDNTVQSFIAKTYAPGFIFSDIGKENDTIVINIKRPISKTTEDKTDKTPREYIMRYIAKITGAWRREKQT